MAEHTYHTDITMKDDDPRSVSTVLVGLVGFVLLLVIVLCLHAIFLRTTRAEFERKVIASKPQELRLMRTEHTEMLNGYRWVSESDGVATIPIDRAMDLVVTDYDAKTREGNR